METVFEIQRVILEQFAVEPFYQRDAFANITLDNRITGIVGGRGIGKTTYMLHQALLSGAKERRALYVSADNLFFIENRLIDLVDQLYKETKVRLLCIDEVHKYPNWNQELKNIVDTYRDFRILFSGSSMIDIIHAKYDLSRRVTLHTLHGLSFREYLEFYFDIKLPKLSFDDLIHSHINFAQKLALPNILEHFKEYLRVGYYPFFREFQQEREKFQAIENSVQKTIYEDIAVFKALKTPTLMLIEKLYKYVLNSLPGEINASKLASTLGKDFESISEYLKLLEQAGLIRFLYPHKSGKAFLRNPVKMYPENTNLIYASYLPQLQDATVGKVRETFALNQLQNIQQQVYFSEMGDFAVNNFIFEIGGKNKTMKQIKDTPGALLLIDNIVVGTENKIPLYLLGFLS